MPIVVQASANGGFSSARTWSGGIIPNTVLYTADAYRYKVNIDSNINPSSLTLTSSGGFVLSATGTTLISADISAANQPYPVLLIQGSSTVASITGTIYGGVSSNAVGISLSSSASAFVFGNVYGGPLSGATTMYGISSLGSLWVSGNCISLSSAAVNATAGNFTLYGNISALSAVGVTLGGSVSSNIYGNVAGSSRATTYYGINHSSTGYLLVNGNINGYRASGVNSTGSGTISAIGNVTGGTVATSSARGIGKTTAGSIFLSGNAYGGTGDNGTIGIFFQATNYNLIVYGNISANAGHGIQFQGSSVFVSGGNINGGNNTSIYGLQTLGTNVSLVTIYNSISGGTGGTAYGYYNTSPNAVIYIYSNSIVSISAAGVANGGTSPSTMYIPYNKNLISPGTGSPIVNTSTGTINLTANVFGSSLGNGLGQTGAGTINLSGNVTGGSGASTYGINNSSAGTVNIIGNVAGGSGTSCHGINNTGYVNLTGNVISGSSSTSNGIYGFASGVAAGTVNVLGNVTGGNGVGNAGIYCYSSTITGVVSTGDYPSAYGVQTNSNLTINNDLSSNINKASYLISSTYGPVIINGNVYTGVSNTSGYALSMTYGNLTINGNLIGVSNIKNNAGLVCGSSVIITITGNLYPGIGGIGIRPYISGSGGLNVNGTIINSTNNNANLIDNILAGGITISCNNNIYSGNSKIVNMPRDLIVICKELYGYKNNVSFNVGGTLNAQSINKIQMGELGAAPFSNLTITSPTTSFNFTAYTGGFPNYSLQGSATNSVSSLPAIQSITGVSNTLKTITFNSAHNITSTAGILSSSGFSDSTWNGVYGIVSIPSPTQVSVTGNFATTPSSSFGTSVLIYQTGYYGSSALVLTDKAHQLNSNDTVYSYNFYDSTTLSWNGTFNTINLSPSAFYMIGPSTVPLQYGIIAATKYFTQLVTPQYATQTGNITPPSQNDVRGGVVYYSGTQTGNVSLPPASSVDSNTLVDNGSGVNVFGTMKTVPTSSVRSNTVYGYLTGNMNVPSPAFVQYNVPVDQTKGSALLYPSDIWSYPVSSVNTNTVGSVIKNIASKSDFISLI